MVRRTGILFVCALLSVGILAAPASARKKKRRSLPTWEWKLDVSAAAIYNDNLLRLSERDLNSFQRDSEAFPVPLESSDDFENEISLQPQIYWRAPMTLMISGDYRLKATTRARNGFTDYQTHTFGATVRPRVAGYRWAARFRVFTIPSFYLRVYRDRDYSQYHTARFSNWDYQGSFRYRLTEPLWLEAQTAWGSYYYNRKFTEYDSEYRDYTIGASYALPWNMDIRGAYTRRLSENIGKDQPVPPTIIPGEDLLVEDTEYGDGDFNEDEWSASLGAVIPWIEFRRTKGTLSYRLRRRVYTTDRSQEQDPFHRGRLDKRSEVTTSLKMSVSRAFDVEAYFTYEERGTDSQYASVPQVKNFIRREFGLVLSYSIQ